MLFKGSGTAIITPFDQNGKVDIDGLTQLIEYQLENQTDAIVVNGTTGEGSTLSKEESLAAICRTVQVVNKRVPVIAGTGSNNTQEAADFSAEVSKTGVDGLLVVTPYYNKSSRKGLYHHFRVIAEHTAVPIILYTVPGRTGVSIPVETVAELAKIENIIGIKDAAGDLSYTAAIRRSTPKDFAIYSGNDDLIVPVLSVGGTGVISVVSNILPKETHNLVHAYLEGNMERAAELQLQLLPLIQALFSETNPIPVKAALELIGLPAGGLRLPLYEAEEETKEKLRESLAAFPFPQKEKR